MTSSRMMIVVVSNVSIECVLSNRFPEERGFTSINIKPDVEASGGLQQKEASIFQSFPTFSYSYYNGTFIKCVLEDIISIHQTT